MIKSDVKSLIRIARESGKNDLVEPLNLGSQVRDLCKAPTYDALKKLAAGLEISVPQLFTPSAKTQINGRIVVKRSNQATAHAITKYEHELLSETLTKKKMLLYRAHIGVRKFEEFNE